MNTGFKNHFDKAMAEVESQRQLFWQSQQRRLKRVPPEWRQAIERGEELLRNAQRRKIESDALFPLL
jgi:hypothetical protein